MTQFMALTAAALISVVFAPAAFGSEPLGRKTPACVDDQSGCYTVQVSSDAELNLLLEGGHATLERFSAENGYESTLTGKEIIRKGNFTFKM
jgi:hypothetical protein